MKKLILAAAFLIAAQSVSAQVFIGGSVGVETVKDGITSFEVAPEIGYALNDRWDVGLDLGISNFSFKKVDPNPQVKGTAWTVAPFVRFSAIQFGDFEILLKGSVSYTGANIEGEFEDLNLGDETMKLTQFGVNIAPLIAYNISEKFTILAQLNCLSVGFNYFENKIGDAKADGTSFGLNANTNNLINTSNFQIGFQYNF